MPLRKNDNPASQKEEHREDLLLGDVCDFFGTIFILSRTATKMTDVPSSRPFPTSFVRISIVRSLGRLLLVRMQVGLLGPTIAASAR